MGGKKGFRAVNAYLVVEPIIEKQSMKGITMTGADSGHLRTQKGTVISAGENDKVEDGDVIYYDAARSFKIILDGKPQTIIRINEVIAVC